MQNSIVLIGAGSSQFGFGTLGDLFQSNQLAGHPIVLHDINRNALVAVEQAGQEYISSQKLPNKLSATTNRIEALQGAAFVIISIEVGNRFELWEQDWQIPQQFGVRQVFGENGGPGGLFHALRIIPPILEICADIERVCPSAMVFNYSNPMSRICTAVHRKYPKLNFTGLCHEIASLARHLPKILDLPFSDIDVTAGGLNHFSVVTRVRHRRTGENLYPRLLDQAPAYFDKLPGVAEGLAWYKEHGQLPSDADLKVDPARIIWPERALFRVMMDRFGCFPITTDSHFGEYIHWAYDAADLEGILEFYRSYKFWLSRNKPAIKRQLSERVVPIMDAIVSGDSYIEDAVNLPNKGLIEQLPDWLVIETPALIDGAGVHNISPGDLPRGFLGLLNNQVGVHDMTAEAAIHGSREAALQALLVDPVVDIYDNVEPLLAAMIRRQSDYLGYLV